MQIISVNLYKITILISSQLLKCISLTPQPMFFSIVLLYEGLWWWRPHYIPIAEDSVGGGGEHELNWQGSQKHEKEAKK